MKIVTLAKRLAVGAISCGTTILIAACYGPMRPRYAHRPSSKVTDPQGVGIRNIKVCLTADDLEQCQPTRYMGTFAFPRTKTGDFWEKAREVGFTVCATDIDGPMGGSFEKKCVYYSPKSIPATITLVLNKR